MSKPACPLCKSLDIYYVERAIEYHSIVSIGPNGAVELRAVEDSYADTEFAPYIWCEPCGSKFNLDLTQKKEEPMPLQLGGVSTERNPLILFDPLCLDQGQEAEEQAAALVKCGFVIKERSEGKILLSHPAKDANHGVFRILSENGDDRVVWDRTVADQVRDAYAKFKEFLAKGYRAYATLSDGRKGHKIEDFDPSLEEIVLIPSTMPG